MTNGEKLQSIFPNIIKYGNILIDNTGALQKNILFDDSWWNAEYKEGKATASNKAVAELGEDLRKTRTAICNKKVLIGFNLAVAVMNKHLGGKK